jgi:endogenous inhibitor of DNA gyrase (YacG/DUF329 family)
MPEPLPEKKSVCPICGKLQDATLRPFCSRRCADIDLGRWLKGGYVVPGEPSPIGPAAGDEDETD